jgi:hypothetical protein
VNTQINVKTLFKRRRENEENSNQRKICEFKLPFFLRKCKLMRLELAGFSIIIYSLRSLKQLVKGGFHLERVVDA